MGFVSIEDIPLFQNTAKHVKHHDLIKCLTDLIGLKFPCFDLDTNGLFLTSEFSGIIYSLFRGWQNVFLTIFSTKFVITCATKVLKNQLTKTKVMSKNIFNKEFSIEKFPRKLKKILIFHSNCPKSASNVIVNLPAIKTFYSSQKCCQN